MKATQTHNTREKGTDTEEAEAEAGAGTADLEAAEEEAYTGQEDVNLHAPQKEYTHHSQQWHSEVHEHATHK